MEKSVTLDCGCKFTVVEEYPPGPGYSYSIPYTDRTDEAWLGWSRTRETNFKRLIEIAIDDETIHPYWHAHDRCINHDVVPTDYDPPDAPEEIRI